MPLTRRQLLATAALVAGPARSFAAGAVRPTAEQVVARIRAAVGIPWQADTVDRIVAGDADTPVSGIATTMMATFEVLRRAAASGHNLVVAHEPTFWSHFDTVDWLQADPTWRAKRDFIAANHMVVFRFHDHWHAMARDGIDAGMTRAMGWREQADPAHPGEFVFEGQTLAQLAARLAQRLDARSMRVLGDPGLPVRRAVASWGYADITRLRATAARTDVDLLIVGEAREWELVPYVADQVAAGKRMALVVLGHVASEQEGMRDCAQWLQGVFPGMPVEFIPADEPLRSYPAPRGPGAG